ncbi:MAG: PKD domain-containing protein, partial [Bacteroidota bacterium]
MFKTIQFILFLSCLAFGSLSAQNALAKSVLSNGAVVASSNNFQVNGTVGQPIIGMQSSAAFNANSGFFAPASASLLMPCDSIITNLNDSGVGSLREALSCAISGDTITFAVNGTIVLTSGEMEIPPGVVINGDGADITIDAQGNSRIFNIPAFNADPVSIRNIYFINGGGAANAEFGGAITANGDLSLINCDFDNSAGENGGAINHTDGNLDIVNCAFVQNESTFQGGALNVSQSNTTIVNSIFYDNFANTLGGVIVGNLSSIVIFNSTLIENSADLVGGIQIQDGDLELYNSIVYGNTATNAITLFPNSVNTASTITAQNLILGQINGSTLTYGVNNIIPNDPQIIDPANDDFSISNTSPAQGNADPLLMPADIFDADVDGDIAELINFDFDRIDRGQGVPGSTFDMGAIENEQGFLQVINTNTFGIGSLGQAIENTNLNTNLNRIEFAIPGDGPHDIVLDNLLPTMDGTDVVIDGATQPGYQPNRPAITIDGNDQFTCLIISSDNCTVSGLRLINGDEFRVLEVGAFSDISLSFNTFVTNLGQDHIGFFGTTNSSVFNNRIGIDTNDVVRNANVTGLALSDCDNMDVQFNNLTGSGNGIALGIFGTSNSFFQFNGIGITNDNFISGGEIGVFLANATGNTLQDNSIGEFRLGIYANEGAQDNIYSENFLFCNQDAGIFHEPGTQIDLQAPVITSATPGELVGTSQPNATIEIFQDTGCGNETVACQGTFVASITADPDGTWSYTDAGITEGLTYTATQTAGFPENTSPFAVCQVAALIVCDIEASALGDTITCDVQEVTLLGNSNKEGASYNWTGPNGFSSTDQNALVNEAGLYTLIAIEGECADTVEVQVVADTLAPELIGLFDRAIDCLSPTVQLVLDTETPDVSFAWTGPNGFTSEEQQPIVDEGGSYSVTATGPNGCESFFTVAVDEDPTVAPLAGFTINVNELVVSFNNVSTADATDFQWDFGNGLFSTEFEPTTSYQTGGFKNVQLIASNECGADTTEFVFELAQPTDIIRFEVEELTEGAPGDTVQVPIRVYNFNDVISFQFSLFQTDATVARFIGVSGFNLTDLGPDDINIFSDSLMSVVWFSGLGASLPDSTIIFNIDMEIIAMDSMCTIVNFGDIPTQSEVGILAGNDIVQAIFATVSGEVCVKPFANIFGQVFREDGRPLENVEVAISSGQDPAITDENGLYEFLELPTAQTYTLTPTRFTNP